MILDIWAAFIVGEKTLMPTEFWVDDDLVEPVAAKGQLDAYCNLAILIFAKIINFLADYQQRAGTSASDTETINSLWAELQAWRNHRLKESLPLFRGGKSKQSPFATIIFTQPSSSKPPPHQSATTMEQRAYWSPESQSAATLSTTQARYCYYGQDRCGLAWRRQALRG